MPIGLTPAKRWGRGYKTPVMAPPGLNDVLSIINSAPDESWVRLNAGTNQLQDIVAPGDLRPLYGVSPAPFEPVQGVWPSIGWDSNRHGLVLWGGGHANTSDNSVYEWRCADRSWRLAYLPSEMVGLGASAYRSVDFEKTPVSSHTYGNNNFLPLLDRFVTLGGAAYNDGGSLRIYDHGDNSFLRYAGAWTLNMAQAGQGKVAGETGSNNKRGAYVGVDINGAEAWSLRDWYAVGSVPNVSKIDNGTAYLVRNGHDALLCTAGNRNVWLIEFVDQDDANDVITQVGGQGADDGEGQGAIAYDPTSQTLLKMSNGPGEPMVQFCDLKRTWGSGNGWRSITLATGAPRDEFVALNIRWAGIVHNPVKSCFTIYNMNSQVWEIRPPAGNPTPDTGWTVTKPTMDTSGTQPRDYILTGPNAETGLIGKFRWASDLNCAITTFGNQAGEVWAYKPAGWARP